MKRLSGILLLLICTTMSTAQIKVTIRIFGLPQTSKAPNDIYLAGSFNMWNPAAKGWRFLNDDNVIYGNTFNLAPGDYEYKFTRGSWLTAECGPKGAGIANRTIHVVHDTTIITKIMEWQDNYPVPVVKKHTASKNVHIISNAFDMPQLGKQRRIWIYLPDGYATSKTKYPVIYMHDGQNLFDEFTGNFGEWGVDEFLDGLKPADPKFIVVGIDNGESLRMAEYSPYDSKYAKGSGDAYVTFLVETLKPYIDKNYRTFKDASHTTIAGSSMGGLISMYATLKHPEVFGNAGIFSPAFWVNPQIYDYAKQYADKASRYYFVCGDLESEQETAEMNKMVTVLTDKGLPAQNIPSVIVKGAKHNEQQWKGDFSDFYKWLIKRF